MSSNIEVLWLGLLRSGTLTPCSRRFKSFSNRTTDVGKYNSVHTVPLVSSYTTISDYT